MVETKDKIQTNLEEAFQMLRVNLTDSFQYMQDHPEEKPDVISDWKGYLRKFVDEATSLSEQYKNKDLIKAISRMFIFGR
jgi:uncharacterized protein YktB (UPF0637 family)